MATDQNPERMAEYMEAHPWCESCGSQCFSRPHRIMDDGGNEPDNLLRLCAACRQLIVVKGLDWFAQANPRLCRKIMTAKYKTDGKDSP